ncbi:minor capsid protein [Aerococcaceae bacterium DSM 111020]|nr:minor capsid protein [Aerococcaceae bacterium DSM 111020]
MKKNYERERKIQNDWAKADFDAEKMLEEVFRASSNRIQSQIDGFYLKYARANGLSRADANKRLKGFDVPAWAEKAAKAVAEKDFSPYTNDWMRTYNAKMNISRLELLKAELDLELMGLYSDTNEIMDNHLTEAYLSETKRQAGIMKMSSSGSVQRAKQVVNADFYGINFSERIWGRTGMYQEHKKFLFGSLNRMFTDMNGYRQERNRLMKEFGVTESEAMRLLRTESARIRSTAQRDKYNDGGFTHYRNVAELGACKVCADFDGKVYPVEDGVMGETMFPFHPNCRCSTYGIIEMVKKDGTSNLDDYDVVD